MRAVVVTGERQVVVEDREDPRLPGPDGAVVQVEASAICGSDLHFYDGDLPVYPVAVGHEAVGTVIEVGTDARTVEAGDRVLVSSVAGCGRCPGCAAGDPVLCVGGPKIFGTGELGGAQATLLAVPTADFQLLRVPDGVTEEAALLLTDNLATGWAGAERADVRPGCTVLVLGLGAVGLCAVRAAYAQGAARVLAVDPVPGRRARAEASGAVTIDPVTEPVSETALEATRGRGADAVIDSVALDRTVDDALASVRPGGTVSVIGVAGLTPYPMSLLMGLTRNLTLRMTTAPIQGTWPALVPLVQSGRLDASGIITGSYPLEDAAAAYAAVAARSGEQLKVVLRP